MRLRERCTPTSQAPGLGTALSYFRRFIRLQPSPATAKELNTAVPQSTRSSGSTRTGRRRILALALRGSKLLRAGANVRASDVFTLLKCDGEWTVTHKLFHWHDG